MTAAAVLRDSAADGVTPSLSATGIIKATGEKTAVTRWLPAITTKPDENPVIEVSIFQVPKQAIVLPSVGRKRGAFGADVGLKVRPRLPNGAPNRQFLRQRRTENEEAMLVSHDREKMINAIIYFANHTRHLGKIKLFKLLYLLDFEHFRQTGRSVTGLDYRAWKYGPVPVALVQEWDEPEPDMTSAIRIEPEKIFDYVREAVAARASFDDSHFTKRELRIMADLAAQYCDVFSHSMIDVTHAENGAWARVWNNGSGFDQPIDYALSLAEDDPHRAAILEFAREHQAIAHTARG